MDIQASALIVVPVITGLNQVLKVAGVATRWLPLTSVILGVIGGVLFIEATAWGALAGIVAGLASSGLYDFSRKTIAGN